MNSSESQANLAAALVAAQADLRNPEKASKATIPTKTGGSFTYDYAALDEIVAQVRPALAKHGIVVLQEPVSVNGTAGVSTLVLHSSGEWLEFGPLLMPVAADARAMGSVITYFRRYSLLAALGLAAGDDDDGASAGAPKGAPSSGGTVTAPAPASTSAPAMQETQPASRGTGATREGADKGTGSVSESPKREAAPETGPAPAITPELDDDIVSLMQKAVVALGSTPKVVRYVKEHIDKSIRSEADLVEAHLLALLDREQGRVA